MRRLRPIRDPLQFGFAVGRVRVLETRLLKRSTYERLLDAPTFVEQRRILSETPYGSYLETVETAEDVERALDGAQLDVYRDFLKTANLPGPIVEYFTTLHDFENIRGMLKAEALGIESAELLNDLGSVAAERFASGALPPAIDRRVRTIRAAVTGEDGSLLVDLVDAMVDAAMFAALLEVAADSGYDHLLDLARTGVDVANVRVLVRTRLRAATVAEAQRFFVAGGTVPVERFVEWYRLPLAELAGRLGQLPTFRGMDLAALEDPRRFDVLADAIIARVLTHAAMVPVGPEPVVAYILARRAEISMLRTLLIGRLAGVGTEVLRDRLRGVA